MVRVGGGRDLADGGGGPAESIDVGHREVDVRLAGGSENVQHGVGGAAHCDVEGHRVFERLLGADRAGEDRVVLFLVVPRGEIDDLATGLKEKPLAIAVGGDDGAVARQRQTERLCEAVHRVGGEHARTRPTGRAGGALHLLHVFVADGRVAGLDHRVDEVELDLDAGELGLSGLHWSAGDEDRRDVEAHRRHQHAGRDLVAVGDAHQRVGTVGVDHVLDRVGDEIAAREAVEHAVVPHGDAVVDRDGVELLRHPAGGFDLAAHELPEILEVDVAGYELGERVRYGDDRFVEVVVGHAGGTPERSGTGLVTSLGGGLTAEIRHGRESSWSGG